MNSRSLLANWYIAAVLQVVVLWASLTANAMVKGKTMRITVLDEETHEFSINDTGVPKNCDFANFDAYCNNSRTTVVTNVLLVQEGKREPYRVTCTVETRWSRCKPLLKGYSFDAQKEKRGLLIYYLDEVGKLRKQLYTYLEEDKAPAKAESVSDAAEESSVAAQRKAVPASTDDGEPQRVVECSFTSSPPGADILVDGKYVGSTPSALSLTAGNHRVVISMTGFVQWKRELTVSPGSELTVNAVLEKQ